MPSSMPFGGSSSSHTTTPNNGMGMSLSMGGNKTMDDINLRSSNSNSMNKVNAGYTSNYNA